MKITLTSLIGNKIPIDLKKYKMIFYTEVIDGKEYTVININGKRIKVKETMDEILDIVGRKEKHL